MLQSLPPELIVNILSYCNYTTNTQIKTLNHYFYKLYHAYFDYIIKSQYNIHPKSIKQLYSLINDKNETNPITKLIWIKGTLLWNYIDRGPDTDFISKPIPPVLYPHIHLNTVITFRHNLFNSFDFPINCTLETLSNKLYTFWNITQIVGINFKIYFISDKVIPHRIDFNANRQYYPYFTFFQRQFLDSLNYIFRLVS